ncbi:hypothetical protein BDF21DRAFT_394606 [Thamnidium elegans]|nr:hypothetical protein BDF21DRAFT_394606 [Thamnidium elegans]
MFSYCGNKSLEYTVIVFTIILLTVPHLKSSSLSQVLLGEKFLKSTWKRIPYSAVLILRRIVLINFYFANNYPPAKFTKCTTGGALIIHGTEENYYGECIDVYGFSTVASLEDEEDMFLLQCP